MKRKLVSSIAAILLLAQAGLGKNGYAFNPQPPWCTYNCVLPTSEIYAHPSKVFVPPGSTAHTKITWKWSESENSPVMPYACVYVVVDNSSTASLMQCEHPGNCYYTDVPWIQAPHVYDFIVSANVGNAAPVSTLKPLASMKGANNRVRIAGVVGSKNSSSAGHDDICIPTDEDVCQ